MRQLGNIPLDPRIANDEVDWDQVIAEIGIDSIAYEEEECGMQVRYSLVLTHTGVAHWIGENGTVLPGEWDSPFPQLDFIRLADFIRAEGLEGLASGQSPGAIHGSCYRLRAWEKGRSEPLEWQGLPRWRSAALDASVGGCWDGTPNQLGPRRQAELVSAGVIECNVGGRRNDAPIGSQDARRARVRRGGGWEAMMKHRMRDAPGSNVFFSLRAYADGSRYSDEGNFHRARWNHYRIWALAIVLSTAIAVMTVSLLGPLR